jgi:hypothetical protein
MTWWFTLMGAALAQENGVQLCADYDPFILPATVDPDCQLQPDPAIYTVNSCFVDCSSAQQEFHFILLNRGGDAARQVRVRVRRDDGSDEVVWSQNVGLLASLETVELGPIVYEPLTFDENLVVEVTAAEDCNESGNVQPLTTAFLEGFWPEPSWDADGDGVRSAACGGLDCDDSDPTVFPGAPEEPTEEKNCDGIAAEGIRTSCGTLALSPSIPLVVVGLIGVLGVTVRRRR